MSVLKRLGRYFQPWPKLPLEVVEYEDAIRITTDGYTQSKSITQNNWQEGYWYYQATAVKLGDKPKVLILGYGGGTLAVILRKLYPDCEIDGVENDREIVELGEKRLNLDPGEVNLFIEDARKFIESTQKSYDFIAVDMYEGNQVPEMVFRGSFYQKLNDLLNPKGAVTINRIFDKRDPEGKKAYLRFEDLLKSVFPKVKVVEVPSSFLSRNYIFVGSK